MALELEFKNPPRGRTNDLLPYEELAVELGDPENVGRTARIAKDVSVNDAARIVRSMKTVVLDPGHVIETVTAKAESLKPADPADKLRDVYATVRAVAPAVDPQSASR